jgi:hypothetical protein
MKKLAFALLVLTTALTLVSCGETTNNKKTNKENTVLKPGTVEVYYFHGTRRCVTCVAVGDVAGKLVDSKYGDNKQVKFIEVNIDEDGPGIAELAQRFLVTGSGLYVSAGEKIENITAFAFQKAIAAPEQLENKLIELIDKNL